MRRRDFLLALSGLLASLPALAARAAPKRVPAAQAAAHLGESITVIGVVAEVSRKNRGGHIYLNFGAPFPKQQFAVVIFKNETSRFPTIDSVQGKTVEITGVVREMQGQRRIQLVAPEQLKVR